jgi:L-iditol 2-dehydrogenase
MKAAILNQPGKLEIREVRTPDCLSGGVLVKVKACGICSSDAKMVTSGHRALNYPRILGHEIAGIISESRNRQFKPGDRVQVAPGLRCGECLACRRGLDNQCEHREIFGFSYDGGFAQYISIPLSGPIIGALTLLPKNVSFEDASLGEPLACCINAQEKAGVRSHDTVLIIGAGPLGLLHAVVAKSRKAETVIISEPSEHRRTTAQNIWADYVINPLEENLYPSVLEITDGKGADVVIFACSRVALDETVINLLAPCGRVSIFSGTLPSISQLRLDSNTIHYKELAISGAYGCTARQNKEAIKLMASNMWASYKFAIHSVTLETLEQGIEDTKTNRVLKSALEIPNER